MDSVIPRFRGNDSTASRSRFVQGGRPGFSAPGRVCLGSGTAYSPRRPKVGFSSDSRRIVALRRTAGPGQERSFNNLVGTVEKCRRHGYQGSSAYDRLCGAALPIRVERQLPPQPRFHPANCAPPANCEIAGECPVGSKRASSCVKHDVCGRCSCVRFLMRRCSVPTIRSTC